MKYILAILTREEMKEEDFHIDLWLQEKGFSPRYRIEMSRAPDGSLHYYQEMNDGWKTTTH